MPLKPLHCFALIQLLAFTGFAVKAQSNTNPGTSNPLNTYLNNFVQPAPNAASLGKYADYPVGYFTGVPNVSVPIYDLKDGGISLPVSLSYHAGGIHVSELASWVGLGWALNATGVINRSVRGAPDEGSLKSGVVGSAPGGYYRDHGLSTLLKLPYPIANNQTSDPNNQFYGNVVPAIQAGAADCEPDLYTFNFNGHTGKFVFDEKGAPRLLEDDNLKIQVGYNTQTSTFGSWMITTEDGIQYYFGENGAHETTRPHSNGNVEDIDDIFPSSWYLTRIVNPNTNDVITFNYTNEGYSYFDLGPEDQYFGGLSTIFTDDKICDNSQINNSGQLSSFISTTIQGLKLTSIVSRNFTIKFVANNIRSDVSSTVYQSWHGSGYNGISAYGPPCSLDSIKIYTNVNNACIKQFSLSHSYFNSNPSGTTQVVLNSVTYNGNDNSDTQRLKLTTVTEISGDGTIQKPPYSFIYNETLQLPRRLSYDQDHWGFSNHSPGDNNRFFTPTITNAACSVNPPGANRHPTWPDMSALTLVQIADPLGAITNFSYEPNSANNTGFYSDSYNETPDTLVGGLRIKQIKVTDNVTGTTKVRTFNYDIPNSTQPCGTVIHMPIYIIQAYSEYWQDLSAGSTIAGFQGYIGNSYSGSDYAVGVTPVIPYVRQSQSIVPMQDANGNHIVYPYVKESFGLHGEGGYKQYTLSLQSESISNPVINSRLDYANYTARGTMYIPYPNTGAVANGNFGNGYFNDTIANPQMLPQNLAYSYNYPGLNSGYPFSPQQIDIVSGKTLEEDTYDSANNLLQSITNNYPPPTYHENYWIRGLKAYNENFGGETINNGVATMSTPGLFPSLTFYKLHTGISHLASTTKKTYNGTSFVTEITNYAYESPEHTLKTSETTTDSQGNTITNKTYYSFDYASTATSDGVFGKMKNMNLLEPVHTQTWKNGSLVGERITQFQDFSNTSGQMFINPASIYNVETVQPLTTGPSQANESMTWTYPVATLLPETNYLFPKANFVFDATSGKMINKQLTNDKSQGIIWDNQLKLPVAVADNAMNTNTTKEFYFEGFENSTATGLYTGNGHTGTHSVFAPYNVTWTPPANGRVYKITYWYFSTGKWHLAPEQTYTGSLNLTGGAAFDDIRIYPSDANMATYTYDLAGDLTSTTDAKNLTTYYEYDSFQRLKNIRDYKKNIVKSYCYNYAGQANGCFINEPTYLSVSENGNYTTSCSTGSTGSTVNYVVNPGAYTSNISQTDADNQAIADVTANGQNYANINGTCTVNTIYAANSTSDSFSVNITGNGVNITVNIPAGSAQFPLNPIVPVGTSYTVYITNTSNSNPHTIGLTGQSPSTSKTIQYNGVTVSTGTILQITIIN